MTRHLDRRTRYVVDNNNNRAKKLGLIGRVSHQEWMDILDFYNDVCLACGRLMPVGMDHIVPICKGGDHVVGNIQPLCQPCNSRKATKVIDYRGIVVVGD